MMILCQMNVRDFVMSKIISELVSEKFPFDYNFHNNINHTGGLYCFWLRDTCIYVGMSENLHNRIAQHSHQEDNSKLIELFNAYSKEIKISFIYLNLSANKLRNIESEAILKLHPIANRQGIKTL